MRCYNQLNVVRPRHPHPIQAKALLFCFCQKTQAQGFPASLGGLFQSTANGQGHFPSSTGCVPSVER